MADEPRNATPSANDNAAFQGNGAQDQPQEADTAQTQGPADGHTEQEPEGEAPGRAGTINIELRDSTTQSLFFRVKLATPLRKVMKAFCERVGANPQTKRFYFDGTRINETDTPAYLNMEDNDVIEVFQEQLGGYDEAMAVDIPAPAQTTIQEQLVDAALINPMADREEEVTADIPLQPEMPARVRGDNKLEVTVRDQWGAEIAFRIKPTTMLKKVMDTYCKEYKLLSRKGMRTVRFLYDGQSVLNEDTPQSMEM